MTTNRAPLVKILVAGASRAGKTSLVNYYMFQDFLDVSPTIGINFAQKTCLSESGPINFSIWDLSGQPRFRFLMPKFCSGASGVVLVFDLTNPSSLEAGSTWLKLIAQDSAKSHKSITILAGTKADLTPCISQTTINDFVKTHGLTNYIQCSSKTGKNVRLVFQSLCNAIQKTVPRYSTIHSLIPLSSS